MTDKIVVSKDKQSYTKTVNSQDYFRNMETVYAAFANIVSNWIHNVNQYADVFSVKRIVSETDMS
jgi:hypothetical protein